MSCVSSYRDAAPRTSEDAIGTAPDEPDWHPPPERPPPKVATGAKRLLYLVGGLVCLGLAYLGALLPGLPTTPWVLLASYCFARSSPRLQRWLKRSPIFGRLLRDWEEHRGIRRPVKVVALILVITVVSLSLTFGRLPFAVKCVIGGLALVGLSVIVFVVPTIRERGGGQDSAPREDGGAES